MKSRVWQINYQYHKGVITRCERLALLFWALVSTATK